MASGSPSSRRQISATAPALALVSSKPGATACARSANRLTEAYRCRSAGSWPGPAGGTGSGGTGNSCSPLSRSTVRLVASTTRPGAAPSSSASSGAAPVTCSKLSSTSSRRLGRRYDSKSAISGPAEVFRPSPAAIAAATRPASETEASATKRAPSANPRPSRPAASTMTRALPPPPGAGERHQPHTLPDHQLVDGGGLLLAAHQRRGRHRKSPGQRRLVRSALAGPGHLEPLAQQHRQVVLHLLLAV